MLALAAALVLVALIAGVMDPRPELRTDGAMEAAVVARQFVVYRDAVHRHVAANPGVAGAIDTADLALPPGAVVPASFGNRVGPGELVWVFAADYPPGTAHRVAGIPRLGTELVGRNEGGDLVRAQRGELGVDVPDFVPDGALVGRWDLQANEP